MEIKWFKDRPYLLTLGLLGIFLVSIGVFSALAMGNSNKDEGIVIKKASEVVSEIFIDVGGAVEKPGVYHLPGNSRINDALIKSGGLAAGADREWVEKNLNLAQKLVDGQKIYIPSIQESNKVTPSQSKGVTLNSLQGLSLQEKININTAGSAELDTLYGVGPATAKKIIDNRPYGSIEELLTKKAVKGNVYEQIKDKVSLY